MALLTCPECGKEFSDKASACPNCGCPTEYALQVLEEKMAEPTKCPFCGSESIDEDGYCNDCGYKIPKTKKKEIANEPISGPYTICPQCKHKNKIGVFTCENCGHKYLLSEYILYKAPQSDADKNFHGVYRYFMGQKSEVYCPRCGSEDCSIQREEKVIPGKTKTSYTANLNPFKPFTFANKKEKIVRKERTISNNVFVCNKCGKTFY